MAFLDFFTGFDSEEEQARSDRLDAELRALNEKQHQQRGDDWFQQAQQHIEDNRIDDFSGEVNDAALEGLSDGADNIRHAVGGTINTVAGTFGRIIPWQIMVIVLIGGALYLGVGKGLFKR